MFARSDEQTKEIDCYGDIDISWSSLPGMFSPTVLLKMTFTCTWKRASAPGIYHRARNPERLWDAT
jgi:hypothetical protein